MHTTTLPAGPWGFAFRTIGTHALMYVTSRNGGAIGEIDVTTDAVLRTIPISGRLHGLALAPDGSTLYVSADLGTLAVVGVASGTITRTCQTRGGRLRQRVTSADGSVVYGADDTLGVIARAHRPLTGV